MPSELLDGTGVGFVAAGVHDDSLQSLRLVSVSYDYFESLDVPILAGRSYNRALRTDSSAYLLNEAGFKLLAGDFTEPLHDPADAIGMELSGWRNFPPRGELIGVTENFNLATLHEEIEPMLFLMRPPWFNNYIVQLQTKQPGDALSHIEQVWNEFYPGWPFEYQFADKAFEAEYRAEERLAWVVGIFSALAIVVACLGLFGLAAFAAERRRKEIGVRKVLGASVSQIIAMLSSDFLKIIGLSFLIAAPVAWYGLDRWLTHYAYRVEIGIWVFLLAGLIAILVTLLTVSWHSVKAASMNPVRSLRSE